MPYKDKEQARLYLLEYRKRKRREYRQLVPKRTTAVYRTPEEQEVEDQRIREYQRKYQKKWSSNNKESYMYYAARNRAKKHNREFSIDKWDIVIPEKCPILNTPFTKENGPSLDRVDNSKGYIKGNIEVISRKANMMKFDATPEELVAFSNAMLSRYGSNI